MSKNFEQLDSYNQGVLFGIHIWIPNVLLEKSNNKKCIKAFKYIFLVKKILYSKSSSRMLIFLSILLPLDTLLSA